MRKPRLTIRVLDGISTAVSNLQAGDVASAFGTDGPEERRLWDDMTRAANWAREMREWMAQKRAKDEVSE